MNEVRKIKSEVDVCEKKKIWCEYENLKGEVDNLIKDKKESLKMEKIYQKKLEPYLIAIKKIEERNQLFLEKKTACVSLVEDLNFIHYVW